MNKFGLLAAVILMAIAAAMYYRADNQIDIDTARHVDLKRELVRIDSLTRAEQKRQFDSLMHHIDSIHHKIADYERINSRLRQQNTKLDAIYRAVHVAAMPDL